MKAIHSDYYTSRSSRLLRDFDRMAAKVKAPLIARYGDTQAGEMVNRAHAEYGQLIPALPYVGGEMPFTQFVISSGWLLAFYKVMRATGATTREAGELAFELSRTYLSNVSGFARRLLGFMTFTPRYQEKLRRRAEESQAHPYPRGYVYNFVAGDGVNFDYGVDYHQCATWTLFQEQGAAGLTPYLCACDYLYSKMLGWGLKRTTTLSEGGEVCDFRFKRGGPTCISSTVLELK